MTTHTPVGGEQTLDEQTLKRLKDHFLDSNGFMKQDWYYRDGGKILFNEIVYIFAQELGLAHQKGREEERREIKQEIDSLIDGHYDNPNLARDIEDLFKDIEYLDPLTPQNGKDE